MRILFIFSLSDIQSLRRPLRDYRQIQFGISYISSLLKKNKHNTRLVVLSRAFRQKNRETLDAQIKNYSPQLICFTAISSEYNFIEEIARYIKTKYPDIYLFIGGCHASLQPERIPLDIFDALCIGEGEYPTLELVTQIEAGRIPSGIANIWFNRNGAIEKNPVRHFIADLDVLPFPDRMLWESWIDEQLGSGISVLLGRGCPLDCSYCCNHAFKKMAKGKYVRFRSPHNIVKEIEEVTARFPQKDDIYLEVESLGLDKDWTIKLCSHLAIFNRMRNKPLSFQTNFRVTPKFEL